MQIGENGRKHKSSESKPKLHTHTEILYGESEE